MMSKINDLSRGIEFFSYYIDSYLNNNSRESLKVTVDVGY